MRLWRHKSHLIFAREYTSEALSTTELGIYMESDGVWQGLLFFGARRVSLLHRSHATSGYVGLSQLKKQKLEAAGSSGAVQGLRMENDAPVVGPDAPTANSKMFKLDIATSDWGRRTSGLRVTRPGELQLPTT